MSDGSKKRTMTKTDLVNKIASEQGMSATEVKSIVQSFLDKLSEGLKAGDRIEFRDFGVFEVVTRKAKIGRNPRRAAVPIAIPERCAVKFTAGKKMKEMIERASPESSHKKAKAQLVR